MLPTSFAPARQNEVIVNALVWDRSLPWAVEAFVVAGERRYKERLWRNIIRAHHAFLKYYGLQATEVPLLHYRCSGQEPVPPAGEPCFVDVSESD